MFKKVLFLLIVLILTVSVNIFAQNVQELRVGSFFSGNLNAGQEIWYSVRAVENGFLSVETSGNIDTYLEAYDNNRNIIIEDDDGGEELNAKAEFVAIAGRTYLFKLRGFNSSVTGPFRVFASQRPMPQITELRIGSFHSGNIASGGDYWFSVRADMNGILTVETSGDIDTMLDAYDSNFVYIDSDDDSGENYNAKIEIGVRNGITYYFNLSGYGGVSGAYRITASTSSYPVPVSINFGTFQSGNLSAGQDYWYSVRTARRGTVTIETMGTTDTYLEAYSDSYELLSFNDDGGENTNAKIELLTEANRTLIFRLKGYSTDTTGPFRIFASFE